MLIHWIIKNQIFYFGYLIVPFSVLIKCLLRRINYIKTNQSRNSEHIRVSFPLIKVLTFKLDWYFPDSYIVTEIGSGFGGNRMEIYMGQNDRNSFLLHMKIIFSC